MITKRRLGAALLLTAVAAGRPAATEGLTLRPTPSSQAAPTAADTPEPSPRATADPPRPSATPKAAATRPSPAIRKTRRSIRLSIDDAIAEVLRAHEQPCDRAEREGVPCFPITVETEGPRFSVADALRRYSAIGGKPAPGGPPRTAEVQKQLSGGSATPLGGYSFDPGCALKSLVRMVSGHGNTFYLYRMEDRLGVQPLLTDRKLSRDTLDAHPEIRELMGEYFGECDAVAAWRKALREQRAAEQTADDPPADPPGQKTPEKTAP